MEKTLHVEYFENARDFVKFVNSLNLKKEDILTLRDKPSTYTLFYYQ